MCSWIEEAKSLHLVSNSIKHVKQLFLLLKLFCTFRGEEEEEQQLIPTVSWGLFGGKNLMQTCPQMAAQLRYKSKCIRTVSARLCRTQKQQQQHIVKAQFRIAFVHVLF